MSTPESSAEAFVFLLARHERLIGSYVMTLVPHPADADDILQEAKLVMWRHFSQFQQGTNFAAWARKIAFHQVLAFRKRKKRDRLEFSEAFLNAVAEELESHAPHLEKREQALHLCLTKLPKEHREVVLMRYHQSLELEEMASRLNRSTGALYRLLSRIRQTLHGCVSQTLKSGDYDYAS